MPESRNWSVAGWTRTRPDAPEPQTIRVKDEQGQPWTLTEQPDPEYEQQGATIRDESAGVTYNVTITRRGNNAYVSSLNIEPDSGQLTADQLRKVNVDLLADAVRQYLDQAAELEPDEVLIFRPGAVRLRGETPDLAELAEQIESGKRLEDLEKHYGVSRATVSRWVRQARDEGRLPPAATGRPRSDTKPSKTTTTKGRNAQQRKGNRK